jgi:yersiniabactin salicyl-AMP ligase
LKNVWDGVQENCEGWQCVTYGDKLREWAKSYGACIALAEEGRAQSYEGLKDCALELASVFLSEGLRKGDRAIMQLGNSIFFAEALFALWEIGAVPVMALPSHNQKEIEGISGIAKPRAYIGNRGGQNDKRSLAVKEAAIRQGVELFFYEDCLMNEHGEVACKGERGYETPDYKDIAMLLLSGGTTGAPKLIPRTHGDYIYDNHMTAARCRLNRESVFLAVLPVAHNFVLGNPGLP